MSSVISRLHDLFAAAAGPEAGERPYSEGSVLASGEVIDQVASAPLLSGVLSGTARHIGERYPAQSWRPEDFFLSNSPFHGGLSLETLIVMAPVVARDGAGGLVGLAVQYRDIGAMSPTAFALRRETRHEGFCLALLRIAAPDDRLPETLLAMLRANVRFPDELTRWLTAQVSAVRRIAAQAGVLEALRATVGDEPDSLGRIPEGRFSGQAGPVRAEVTVSAGAAKVTLSLSDPGRMEADCNSPLSATRAAVLTAMADVTGVPLWRLERQVGIETGPGDALNAAYPSAVARGALTAFACYEAVYSALKGPGEAAVTTRSFPAFAGGE